MKIYLANSISECIDALTGILKEPSLLGKTKKHIFAEDKITLSIELALARSKGQGFFGDEVLTLNRYLRLKHPDDIVLSKQSSVMSVKKITSNLMGETTCFTSSLNKPNMALTLYELISQLESAGVKANDLGELIDNNSQNISGALLLKIKDIRAIYKQYEQLLEEQACYDGNNYLSLLPKVIESDENIKNADVYLVGFSTATKQRLDVFEAFEKNAKSVTAIIIGSEDRATVFTNEVYLKLKNKFPNSSVLTAPSKISTEVKTLLKNMYNPRVFTSFDKINTNKINIYEAKTPEQEVKFVCKQIKKYVLNGGRYKEVTLLVGNLNDYLFHLKKAFSEFDIPYNLDHVDVVSDHPIANYVLAYVELLRKGMGISEFVAFVQSPLFNVDKTLTDGLVNYVYKFALTRKELKEPFTYADENLHKYEKMRALVCNVYSKGEKAKTASQITSAIRDMLSMTLALENLDELSRKLKGVKEYKLADVNDKVYEYVDKILTEISSVLKDVKITLIEYKNILASGFSATNIGTIPLFNDAVYVDECKDGKILTNKVLFAIGLNGDVPFSKSDTALLSDGDLSELDGFKIIVEPKIKVVNKREKENVILALTAFENELNLSYSNVGFQSEKVQRSEVVDYFTKIFNLKVKSIFQEGVNPADKDSYLTSVSALETIASNLDKPWVKNTYVSAVENAQSQTLTKLKGAISQIEKAKVPLTKLQHGENMLLDNKISATKIEKYFSCPYANYAQNHLALFERETGDMRVNEVGTMLHLITEKYVQNIDKVCDKTSSNALVEILVNEVIKRDEYARYLNSKKYEFTFKRLKKEGERICYAVYESIKNSNFKILGTEVAFGTKEYPPITLKTSTGEYKLRGKVDRVDKTDDGKIRIIDYKTGTIDGDDKSFYVGKKLQLYLYMNAFKNQEITPVGAYYFPVHDRFLKTEDGNYVMVGKTLSDEKVIKDTDVTLQKGEKSQYVKIKLKKDGDVDSSSQTLSAQEFESYLKYALKVAEKGVEEIAKGNIQASPYKNSCKYCSYGSMCGFSTQNGGTEREENGKIKEKIINATK